MAVVARFTHYNRRRKAAHLARGFPSWLPASLLTQLCHSSDEFLEKTPRRVGVEAELAKKKELSREIFMDKI